MKRTRAVILVVGLLLTVCGCAGSHRAEKDSISAQSQSGSELPCLDRHGFAVFGFRAVRDGYDRVSVVGEIRNTGSAARGVELQASLRDADGRVVAVGHFCPASNRNIVPDETWPFTYSFGRQEDAVEAELRIVDAFRAADILATSAKP
jgi:hypothetical protein